MILKRINYLLPLSILFTVGFGSCITLNSHQTGRTVGYNNNSIITTISFGDNYFEKYFHNKDSKSIYLDDFGVFQGISDNFDIGIKVNSMLTFTGTGKYQFIGDKNSLFASSVGLDLGYNPILLFNRTILYNGGLSLYNSIHPTDFLAFTLSPRYIGHGAIFFGDDFSINHIFGYSAGIIIGRKHQISIELSQFNLNKGYLFDNKPIFSLGYIFKL